MIIDNHLYCNCCEKHMGQLHAVITDRRSIPDLNAAPHLLICADCKALALGESVQDAQPLFPSRQPAAYPVR